MAVELGEALGARPKKLHLARCAAEIPEVSMQMGTLEAVPVCNERANAQCSVSAWPDAKPLKSQSPAGSKAFRAFVWTLIMLCGLETVVRVRAVSRYGWRQGLSGLIDAQTEGDYALQTGVSTSVGGAVLTINRWGIRGREVALHKPANTHRILCLGESTTFGQPGDDDDAIWPARLERRLSKAGAPVEVINGAAPGHTTEHSRRKLDRLLRFDPDLVIIYHAATDIAAHGKRQFTLATESVSAEAKLSKLRDRVSMGYMLMRRNTAAWLMTQFRSHRVARLDQRGVDRFRDSLAALVEQCRRQNVGVLLCTFPRAFCESQTVNAQIKAAGSALFFNPHLDVDGLNDAYARYNEAIRSVAREASVGLIDLDVAITADAECFIDSVHLSTEGHDRTARCVADVIDDRVSKRAMAGAVQ